MSDIALLPSHLPLPQSWRCLYQDSGSQIAVLDESGPHSLHTQWRSHLIIALLSQTHSPDKVIEAIRIYRENFIEHIGVSAGILWIPETGEYCVFRDPFGFIPMMSGDGIFTSSPDLQALFNSDKKLNHAWLDRFAQCRDTTSRDDLWEGTERIRPGEAHFVTRCGIQAFLDEVISDNPELSTRPHQTEYIDIWTHRNYKPSSDTEAELTVELRRQIINAANRIPSSNPCFTLSGGLDSTGILASYHQKHEGRLETISMVSPIHASCDESSELDVLEKTFPLNMHRLPMDHAWPLSKPHLYRRYRAYGPLCAPGIESTLSAYQAAYEALGPRTIITGYGGNCIVKVRREALWHDMIIHGRIGDILTEIPAMKPKYLRELSTRVLGNLFNGKLRKTWKSLKILCNPELKSQVYPDVPHTWFSDYFKSQCEFECTDPVFAMSHTQERAWIPLSWDWEFTVRAMDILARESRHCFYDPLYDLKLFDFCATIPPKYFLYADDYRRIYRRALAPLLPPEIIHHPKCRSFDSHIHDGLARNARELIESAISRDLYYFKTDRLLQAYQQYCRDAANEDPPYPLIYLWRSLSICIWL